MKALIDTNAFIWMDTDMSRLSSAAVGYFNNPHCTIYLSVVSVWEVAIKSGNGKLTLSADIHQVILDIQKRNPLQILPVELPHSLAIRTLPKIHKDPFDRMLIAQAMTENAILLTSDKMIRKYPVRTDW